MTAKTRDELLVENENLRCDLEQLRNKSASVCADFQVLATAAQRLREIGEKDIADNPSSRSTVWSIMYHQYRDLVAALDLPIVKTMRGVSDETKALAERMSTTSCEQV